MTQQHLMYDSVNAGAIPGGTAAPAATAGYVDGWYNNSSQMKAMFPNIPHIAIAVFAKDDADALDCEPGDATIYDAPAWADRQYKRGVALPIVYTSASNIAELRRLMGGRNFLLWSAHYTGAPHLCGACGYPGADATQFWDHGTNGQNIDQTLMSDAFYTAIGGASSMPAPGVTPSPVPNSSNNPYHTPSTQENLMRVVNVAAIFGENPPSSQALITSSGWTHLNDKAEVNACSSYIQELERDPGADSILLLADMELVTGVLARIKAGK